MDHSIMYSSHGRPHLFFTFSTACFRKISAVVTQPGRPTGRKRIIKPSPVEALARDAGVPEDSILTPESARDEVCRAGAPALKMLSNLMTQEALQSCETYESVFSEQFRSDS